ncbi:lysine N(6)-hydroxylase/L-ornithine N(5)-oxygenase family protein [Pseudonocardia sp. WMMC193]|uniref:lysine N(6)-hydroxylase/L-ornithine N(5)-oxygenase family protein n=1 Tax=Pseudonocardia sp. WMMC193 TaxID=2911965 RepID=UPI001F21DA85|nr:lysine N(6)-hydroxylase/L-ornithine N(5)-oxygenase family protein [Pseudonocardia sp. WMMC193]MCF7549508.1 lysine N(6)-hydroxylase/L-ornithine N(5)-oxygenase family protein [Pseudonocardia sp. WMMC193]
MVSGQAEGSVFDVVGVGFGPSNLAIAIALREWNQRQGAPGLTARFLERQPRFGWHRGMLLEDATMQVSFLKDLATLRNPTSDFSFLAYLASRGRLVDFINYGTAFPTRIEFHDYLEWAADRVADDVDYGVEVVEVSRGPSAWSHGPAEYLDVVAAHADGRVERLRARNVVLATGLRPHLPEGARLGDRVWHNRELVQRVDGLRSADPERFVVVGAGQSAAETAEYLHRSFPSAQVCAVFARYGYSPADDSPFANRVFDPKGVDDFFAAEEDAKRLILDYHANTNYSVVDPDLIERLYRSHYHEKIAGTERLRFLNLSRVRDVRDGPDGVEVAVESLVDGARETLSADALVYATGYRSTDPAALLGDLAGDCVRDGSGRLAIRRDYSVETTAQVEAGLFVLGATEHTHGISSTLLSNVAIRAGEIVDAVADSARRSARKPTAAAS